MANLFCSKVDFLCYSFLSQIVISPELVYFKMELAGFFYDLRDLYSLLYNIMLFFISLVLRQKREEVRQADPINTMVPAVAREMHKLGFDQDIKRELIFQLLKFFLDRFYI